MSVRKLGLTAFYRCVSSPINVTLIFYDVRLQTKKYGGTIIHKNCVVYGLKILYSRSCLDKKLCGRIVRCKPHLKKLFTFLSIKRFTELELNLHKIYHIHFLNDIISHNSVV